MARCRRLDSYRSIHCSSSVANGVFSQSPADFAPNPCSSERKRLLPEYSDETQGAWKAIERCSRWDSQLRISLARQLCAEIGLYGSQIDFACNSQISKRETGI